MTPEPDTGAESAPTSAERDRLRLQQQDLQRRVGELEAQLAALHGSTSWRMTRPLRLLGQVLHGLRSGRAGGALRVLLPRLREAVRQHGVPGVIVRLPRYLRLAPQVLRAGHPVFAPAQLPGAAPLPPPRWHPELTERPAAAAALLDATVSVVIPTLNAGPEFVYLLRKLRTQTWVRSVEIVVVDSGSTDGTVAAARAAGARVVEILPAQFSHSGARNLGAESASGDYLLFMVQDAYPVGDRWIHGLLSYLLDHQGQGMAAVSCTEYCRDDSDMMYECSIATHYDYLGCKAVDRIGEFRGADHESLRVMGQLSNVSCLIARNRFAQYRFRGAFSEDLDLGVRLIRDGLRIAMLASVKVIHSHNRTSHYYLKRTFVGVSFLADAFADFVLPRCESAAGLIAGVVHVARQLSAWVQAVADVGGNFAAMPDETERWLERLRRQPVDGGGSASPLQLGDPRVSGLVAELAAIANVPAGAGPDPSGASFQRSARFFVDDFVQRFNHLNRYAAASHDGLGERQRMEWAAAAGKTFASSLGYALAALWHDRRGRPADDAERRWLDPVAQQLSAGV
jgi:GT2 family glycosyltransferase